MAGIHKLTAAKVNSTNKVGRYGDGGGLWLQVSAWETKSWTFRYMMNGRARQMGLGPTHTISLADAREAARQARQLILEGIDPIDARQGHRGAILAEQAKRVTFADAAREYIDDQRAGWKNAKHGQQWMRTLEKYAFPVIGNMSVADIELAHVLKILKPIWTTKTETASRVRGRIEAVLGWSTVRGYREGDNPARWSGFLDKVFPAKGAVSAVKHFDAMPYADIPEFMAELRGKDSVSARALEFTILSVVRTGSTIAARWSEIDLAAKIWTVPAEHMKSKKELRVPLSDRSVEILEAMPREGEDGFLFPGARAGRGLSNMAMLNLLKGMTGGDLTVHGFRSSFKDWASEKTTFPNEVSEMAMGHVVSGQTEAAYRRGDIMDKRRQLMSAWADYCEGRAATGDNVTAIRAAG